MGQGQGKACLRSNIIVLTVNSIDRRIKPVKIRYGVLANMHIYHWNGDNRARIMEICLYRSTYFNTQIDIGLVCLVSLRMFANI